MDVIPGYFILYLPQNTKVHKVNNVFEILIVKIYFRFCVTGQTFVDIVAWGLSLFCSPL